MSDSEFWRSLAKEFESIVDPRGYVRAYYDLTQNPTWRIISVGSEAPGNLAKCQALVVRCGSKISAGKDPTATWLEKLKSEGINPFMNRRYVMVAPGTPGVDPIPIAPLSEASGILCREFEIAAMKAETTTQIEHLPIEAASSSRRRSTFPKRAAWLSLQLKERGWDWNVPREFSGPDRKTVQKILNGRSVQERVLEKLVVALNHKKIDNKKVTLLDVPSD